MQLFESITSLSLDFYSHVISSALRAFEERLTKMDSERCQDLPIWFLHCFMWLPPHATTAAVAVVVDATAA
jgi:hypothetical protein